MGSDLNDLSEGRLERYFRDRFPDWSWPEDRGSTLVAHKLAVELDSGVTPTHLGLLLFAEEPERHMNGACIDLAAYAHEDPDGNTIDTKRIVGPVPEQIAQALSYIRLSPLVPTLSRKDGEGRMDYPSYVETALQEAVVNAVVHRDYEIKGSQIIIRMFPDRIEFQNPGALYNTLTIENLYRGLSARPQESASGGIHARLQERPHRPQLHGSERGGIPESGQGQPAPVRAPPRAGADR